MNILHHGGNWVRDGLAAGVDLGTGLPVLLPPRLAVALGVHLARVVGSGFDLASGELLALRFFLRASVSFGHSTILAFC